MIARRRSALAVVVALAMLLAPRPVVAEDAATRAAKRHYVKGDKLFNLGKFEQALAEFEAAYQAKPIPKLLFNIAQAHRNLGHYEQAIFSYRKYLSLVPDADNREAVLGLIDELEVKQEQAERDERARQATLDRERERERDQDREKRRRGGSKPIYARWWFWGGIAAVAGASVGTYLIVSDDGIPSTDLGNVVFD
jgi:tetratricopeptide (TPR) repeat protein